MRTNYPERSWEAHEQVVKLIGERRSVVDQSPIAFLVDLGMVVGHPSPLLTSEGQAYFVAKFVKGDDAEGKRILHSLVSNFAPVAAIVQALYGVPGASKARADTVLRSHGFGDGLSDRRLGSLLALMQEAGVIEYYRSRGTIRVIDNPGVEQHVPKSVFIRPETPFGNKVWLRRVLAQCEGSISWLDKHFTSPALEVLWESVDGTRVERVRILSLYMLDYHSGKKVKRAFRDLQRDLSYRGVALEWKTIDSHLIKSTHDRWVIATDSCWNLPNVNAIFSGQHSEILATDHCEELKGVFDGYWELASDIEQQWVTGLGQIQ